MEARPSIAWPFPASSSSAPEVATLKEWSRRLESRVRSASSKASSSSCASGCPSVDHELPDTLAPQRALEDVHWEQTFKLQMCSMDQERLEARQCEQGDELEALGIEAKALRSELDGQRQQLKQDHKALTHLKHNSGELWREIRAATATLADVAEEALQLQRRLDAAEDPPALLLPRPS
mmetsp:Transcript_3423/g.7885  ORF Transcript_3423/g.7885 Transcript_3423/m.7885 type:complete len:179 (+) Transcript_3423:130-666(+)